ncbi:MAG: N-acetylmuramoyl-L-alanine amidase [Ruminococcus sp.]|nr:N-acetylmuramoyl-L-alanine amidase [Ruminococcus sp.]
MRNAKRKIIAGTVFFCCIAAAIGGGTIISQKSESVPTAVTSFEEEPPVIILDAGHGGFDGGCVSAEGVPEKGINLSILLRLRDLLQISGYKVEVTRDSDVSIHDSGIEGLANQKSSDMDNRLALFNKYDNAVCISIHQNQFTDPVYNGAQMFYSATDSRSEMLAKSLQKSFSDILQPDNSREIKLCGKELFLCYFSENPTVMAECGFLSNPEEASLLNTEEYQQKVAMTIFAGLSNYLNNQ